MTNQNRNLNALHKALVLAGFQIDIKGATMVSNLVDLVDEKGNNISFHDIDTAFEIKEVNDG
jgi:hypothetical protein